MRKRSRISFAVLCVALLGVLGRIFWITQDRSTVVGSTANRYSVTVAQVRGTIYDCNREPLVNSEKEYRAAVSPDESLLSALRSSVSEDDFSALRERLSSGKPGTVRMSEPVAPLDGLKQFFVSRRYGERLLAPHLLGYLDAGGENGVCGIEAAFNELLTGYSGKITASFAVDAIGHDLKGIEPTVSDTTASAVGGVALTLDKTIQKTVEDAAAECLPLGAVVVLDPYSGAIRAMASFPTFQPETVADSIEADNGALVNRALALYDCGSVFKIVTAAAALQNGIKQNTAYICNGGLSIEGTSFHCHNRLGHSGLTMGEAFAQSCNLYFIQLASKIGAGKMYSTGNDFGFARAITLAGTVKTPQPIFPSQTELENSASALANMSFGQGYLMASPLHIAAMTATVVNDGVMPPIHLIDGTVNEKLAFSANSAGESYRLLEPENAEIIRKMMSRVVEEGTGKRAKPTIETAAGKTGTAETGQRSKSGDKDVIQSWFTGYYPAENPRYVITVLAEDAENNNSDAASTFRKIADALIEKGY